MLWFSRKCPVDDETREWMDHSFQWLIDELGADVLLGAEVILPTEEFFPDVYNGSEASIRKMAERICQFMDVDPEMIVLQFFEGEGRERIHPLAADGEGRTHALGTYHMNRRGKYSMSLNTDQATNPEMMVATIAHELGHVILLGEGRLDEDYEAHEPLTDLLTVVYGMGIFNANSSFVFEQWTNQQFQGWSASGAGYLSEEAFGYALALYAHLRGEVKPEWAKHLKTNLRAYLNAGTKFIKKNGTSVQVSLQEDSPVRDGSPV
ncbi:hypothetical protein BH24ACI3_BH24ACI3_08280 [soil metagenome]